MRESDKPDTSDAQPTGAVTTGPLADLPDVPDEHHGRGGSYLRDPATGERVLIQRTEPCAGCQA